MIDYVVTGQNNTKKGVEPSRMAFVATVVLGIGVHKSMVCMLYKLTRDLKPQI